MRNTKFSIETLEIRRGSVLLEGTIQIGVLPDDWKLYAKLGKERFTIADTQRLTDHDIGFRFFFPIQVGDRVRFFLKRGNNPAMRLSPQYGVFANPTSKIKFPYYCATEDLLLKRIGREIRIYQNRWRTRTISELRCLKALVKDGKLGAAFTRLGRVAFMNRGAESHLAKKEQMVIPHVSIIVPVYNVEQYLRDMLQSLKDQTYMNFEVVIVNDGSTDRSQEIIDQFCQQDHRFQCFKKENEGLPSTRNLGLEKASGKYVAFYDSDDLLPQRTLEKMIQTAEKEQADLVIGQMEVWEGYNSKVTLATERLSSKKTIGKDDPALVWTVSVANKLYKKETLDHLNLKFENLSICEDGVFGFQYIFGCGKITGCNEIVYRYRRRPQGEALSVSQTVKRATLQDAKIAYDIICKLMRDMNSNLLSIFSRRVIAFDLLKIFYRRIWSTEEDCLPLLSEMVEIHKGNLLEGEWETILASNADLRLERPLMSKTELAAEPIVSFVLSSHIPQKQVNLILASIYHQSMPAFEVIIDANLHAQVENRYHEEINYRIVHDGGEDQVFKNEALRLAKGAYINFVDEDIFVAPESIQELYQSLRADENMDFATSRIKRLSGDQTIDIEEHNLAFEEEPQGGTIGVDMNSFDGMFGNKLFLKSSLREHDIQFTSNSVEDMRHIYRVLKCVKTTSFVLTHTIDRNAVLEKVGSEEKKLANHGYPSQSMGQR